VSPCSINSKLLLP